MINLAEDDKFVQRGNIPDSLKLILEPLLVKLMLDTQRLGDEFFSPELADKLDLDEQGTVGMSYLGTLIAQAGCTIAELTQIYGIEDKITAWSQECVQRFHALMHEECQKQNPENN